MLFDDAVGKTIAGRWLDWRVVAGRSLAVPIQWLAPFSAFDKIQAADFDAGQ